MSTQQVVAAAVLVVFALTYIFASILERVS